jgi:integrase
MVRAAREIPWLDTVKGIYYANWYDQEARRTKRISLGTSVAVEAQARFAVFLVEGREILSTFTTSLTVDSALDHYYEEHVLPKVADKVRQQNAITRLKQHFNGMPLAQVDVLSCRSYAEVRRAGLLPAGQRRGKTSRATDSTIRRELNVLTAAANHALKFKRIPSTAMPTIELPEVEGRTVDDDLPPFLSKEEIQLLFDSTTGGLNAFCQIGYWTGARRASIETLRVEQINWQRRTITLQKLGERKTKSNNDRPEFVCHIYYFSRENLLRFRIISRSRSNPFNNPTVQFCQVSVAEQAGLDSSQIFFIVAFA